MGNQKLQNQQKRIKIKGGWRTLKGSRIEKKSINARCAPVYPERKDQPSYSRKLAKAQSADHLDIANIIRETMIPKLKR